jgi:hypothetical protein
MVISQGQKHRECVKVTAVEGMVNRKKEAYKNSKTYHQTLKNGEWVNNPEWTNENWLALWKGVGRPKHMSLSRK